MKVSKVLQTVLAAAAVVAMGTGGALAVCIDPLGGLPIFQCAELTFIQPPPFPVVLDANGRVTAATMSSSYWQLGFGNENLNNGLGSSGTGNSGATAPTFNGNDHGIAFIDVADMSVVPGGESQAGALCLAVNNWGNIGIDGCVDNPRSTLLPNADDNTLNPYYNVYMSASGYPGYYSLSWQQDYPMAALLKSPDGKWFAAMAVATANRNNDGTGGNGSCAMAPGTNPAPCDFRTGSYNFKDIKNGLPNPLLAGNPPNVVPWQSVPRPQLACTSGCAGTGPRTLNVAFPPAKWFHDNAVRPSNNLAMGGGECLDPGCPASPTRDLTRSPGIGTRDVMTKGGAADPNGSWAGLMRYNLQSAPVPALDANGNIPFANLVFTNAPGFTDIPQPPLDQNGNPSAPLITRSGVISNPDTCWRVQVLFGKKPEVVGASTTPANTRIGRSGDVGFQASSLHPTTITCVGGALAAESIRNPKAVRRQGDYVVTWDTSTELGVSSFEISADTIKGVKSIGSVTCDKCSTGEGASYTFTAPTSSVKAGVKTITIEMISANGNQKVTVPLS